MVKDGNEINFSTEKLKEMIAACVGAEKVPKQVSVHTDTSDFYRIDYDDVVVLDGRPYLVRNNEREGRFGIEKQQKYWVKKARDLTDGSTKILKLTFLERFQANVGGFSFECYRSPQKEARILEMVDGNLNFMQGHAVRDSAGNIIRIIEYIRGDMISKDGDTYCTTKDKSLLIAVDGSENAKRAVLYVAEFLRGLPGYCITLLSIISEPPADYFTGREERQAWVEEQGVKAEKMVAEYRGILIRSGFAENAVNAVAALQDRPSVAECILSRLTELKCSTVVVGRRGISRKEEFLFGSTSSKILREAKDCSIWVIQ